MIINLKTPRGDLIPISTLVVRTIAAPLNNTVRTTISNIPHLKGLPLAHPVSSSENFEISLLLGADFYWHFIGDHIVRSDGSTAVSSRLGYVLLRPLPVLQSCNIVSSLLSVAVNHDSDEQDLQRFWAVEEARVMTYSSDKTFLEQYSSTHITRQDDGSYSAMFPWKDDRPPLPDNYTVCQGRTQSLVHRLAQMPGMLQTYDNILKVQVSRGFIEQAIPDGNSAAHTTR